MWLGNRTILFQMYEYNGVQRKSGVISVRAFKAKITHLLLLFGFTIGFRFVSLRFIWDSQLPWRPWKSHPLSIKSCVMPDFLHRTKQNTIRFIIKFISFPKILAPFYCCCRWYSLYFTHASVDVTSKLPVWLVEFDQVICSGWVVREGAAPSLSHMAVDARVAEHVPGERKYGWQKIQYWRKNPTWWLVWFMHDKLL